MTDVPGDGARPGASGGFGSAPRAARGPIAPSECAGMGAAAKAVGNLSSKIGGGSFLHVFFFFSPKSDVGRENIFEGGK